MTNFRVGIGYDIHRLVDGRPLILGGTQIQFEKGLLGHSDGDALLHSIADAILGACALGDIGKHFPDTDPKFKGADSCELLSRVVSLAKDNGWKVNNVDSNIIAERPKLAPYIDKMREKIAEILNLPIEFVSVKARTNEKLGDVGDGNAIATQAIVLLGD